MMRWIATLAVMLTATSAAGLAQETAPADAVGEAAADLMIILDASGSMWGEAGGETKIAAARRVFRDLVERLPDATQLGVVAYGHRRTDDCADIETLHPMGPLDRESVIARIDGLDPKGRTPITGALERAFDAIRGRPLMSTMALISDGLETCGRDPCAGVRVARDEGIPFLLHVVGFGVDEADVSSLECIAQAGSGHYLPAATGEDLAGALERVTSEPPTVPDGRLAVEVVADGALADAGVRVFRAGTDREVAFGRTYTGPGTNPRVLALEPGVYDVVVSLLGVRGEPTRRIEVLEIAAQRVDRRVDFTTGELAVRVTRNGALSDATVRIRAAGSGDEIGGGRTYTSEGSNPASYSLTPGDYRVEIGSVEIAGGPSVERAVTISPGERTEVSHAFESGTLRVGAQRGGELVDVTVRVSTDAGEGVAQGRTYATASSNPRTFELLPGLYRVVLRAVRLEGRPSAELEVEVVAGETVERIADM